MEYTLAEIETATNKWDKASLLGEGAFGQVFKGVSSKGVLWAVKRSFVMSNDFEVEVSIALFTLGTGVFVGCVSECV